MQVRGLEALRVIPEADPYGQPKLDAAAVKVAKKSNGKFIVIANDDAPNDL
jgi:hypothetical protein